MTPPAMSSAQLTDVFPVLVAITADPAAEAAVRITHVLAEKCGAIPTVLRVVHDHGDIGIDTLDGMPGAPETALSPEYQDAQLAALEAQVQAILGFMPRWQCEVDTGTTVSTIVHRAQQLCAELVILGFPHHNFLRRALVRDTVRGVVEHTCAAVLAIRPTLTRRPSCVMVAVDLSPASLRAAHLACQLVAPGGRVILVYVHPDVSRNGGRTAATEVPPGRSVDAALMSLIDDLSSKKTITVTSVIEHGSSIEGVKAAALRMQPDLVALGSGRHSAVDWFFGDSVSTAMISERQWSLLVVPG